jgi:hypothetical protein
VLRSGVTYRDKKVVDCLLCAFSACAARCNSGRRQKPPEKLEEAGAKVELK